MLKTALGQLLFASSARRSDALLALLDRGLASSCSGRSEPAAGRRHRHVGFVFAFQVLPTIIFVAALFAILYHLGVMQVDREGCSRG